jgi:hypothetical protein
MKNENREHCKAIAERLEAVANGRMYRCPVCGEFVEDNNLFCGCGEQVDLIGDEENDIEPWESVSLWDYFEGGVYDIEYRVNAEREYKSVRIMIACGGPNIFIDTAARAVELYWWTDRANYLIDADTCDIIDEYFEELFQC